MHKLPVNTVPSCRVDPAEATLRRLREAFNAGRTRPAEFRTSQLQRLGQFLKDNKQLLQDALAKDVGKVLWGDGRGTRQVHLCPSQAGPHPFRDLVPLMRSKPPGVFNPCNRMQH